MKLTNGYIPDWTEDEVTNSYLNEPVEEVITCCDCGDELDEFNNKDYDDEDRCDYCCHIMFMWS